MRDLLPTTFHHDTPGLARAGFVPVRLEGNVALDRAGELGALGRPEDDSAVIHDVVDGKISGRSAIETASRPTSCDRSNAQHTFTARSVTPGLGSSAAMTAE